MLAFEAHRLCAEQIWDLRVVTIRSTMAKYVRLHFGPGLNLRCSGAGVAE